jgi:hypothetical protein
MKYCIICVAGLCIAHLNEVTVIVHEQQVVWEHNTDKGLFTFG